MHVTPSSSQQPNPAAQGNPQLAAADADTVQRFDQAFNASANDATGDANDILDDYQPSGASASTAAQDGLPGGVASSQQMAETDADRVLAHKDAFNAAGERYGLPPALLAAIASRESRGGAALDANGRGDNGNAFGMMQIDYRYHDPVGTSDPASPEHIDQAASILKDNLTAIERKHPDWLPERQLQGAVTAYNSGVSNVQTLGGMDRGTTGNDYSNDVWARAQHYAKDWGAAPAAPGTGETPAVDPNPGDNLPPAGLQRGQQGENVKALQEQLVELGVMTADQVATGPGIFGPRTEAAVKQFQREAGLSSSGVFDNATRSALRAIDGGVGRDRNPNNDVTGVLQNRLVNLGYMTADQVATGPGIFGPQTEAALTAFQADNDLQQTGILGKTTFNALRAAGGGDSWPVPGRFTVNSADKPGEGDGEFGASRGGGTRLHKGIDIVGNIGDPVESFQPGTVSYAGYNGPGYGNLVIVDHGNGLSSRYAHLDGISVQAGQPVTADTQIGTVGRTGNTPAAGDPHLHFEIRENNVAVDPREYLQFPQ